MSDGAGSERQLLPRLCRLEKGPNGYGFHLHGEKGKVGQFIRLVEPDSPAETSGLRAGDRLVEVNGENVEKESHQQVVSRIRAALGAVRLLVVDPETDEQLRKLGVQCREEMIHGLPAAGQEKPEEKSNEEPQEAPREEAPREQAEMPDGEEKSHPAERKELRPRLCPMKKGPNGYGFNLHSDKTKPGQYVRAVDPDSPAESSGLRPQDRIIEVNGQCMEGKQHSDVVTAIKAGGDETKLLVVDSLTDEFFKKCKVIPSEEHLTGPLPEPVANGEVEKEDSREERPESVSESPSSPEPMAVSPSFKETYNESDSQEKEEKRNSMPDPLLDLNVPLAVAKERAHQKRTSKRAPQMDWSKKNELFSNL
ncbi:Na(+)/H(+) exchange regulatory cofactor NHE-RF1 [Malaclemys terrapin pileata]|uniref:Na(+)/H(+) exchange regulatory cofactor NHE-RF1 n=1 Tax=Malaclemys terrapin pileata TaxID=2991368 RepID=UPI0023A8874F|nr:Na(+)/H(+) exchange regulatory cofactor NHE-RF1 [Malaclemys terrapin pileata]